MTATKVVSEFDVTVALNRALAADAAVKATKVILSREEEILQAASAALELLMQEAGMRRVGSTLGDADMVAQVTYNASDWPALYAHIQKTGEFDLLYKRISSKAAGDRDSNNELPPGIKRDTFIKLKLKAR